MREAAYITANLFKIDHLKVLNETINQNIVKGNDQASGGAIKSSQVKFIRLMSIQKLILPFIDFIMTTNSQHYGFDLFPLAPRKTLNYNTYQVNEEYTWHVDATMHSPVRDIKLTCLLNCSTEKYDGGDFFKHHESQRNAFLNPLT